jgi:outer membrane protein OmpA-like peptidoglycan-associated protein
MSNAKLTTAAAVLCSLMATGGCSSSSKQLATCQAEKEQLLTTIRSQRDTTRSLTSQVASLESRLDEAEKELARTGSGTRLASRPSETPPTIRAESLPWRSPPAKSDAAGKAEIKGQRSDAGSPRSADRSLLALARRDRRLQYDAAARAAKIDLPISFDEKSATLTGEGKRQLDDLARLLKSDDARELRVMVAGFSAGRPSTTAPKDDGDERFGSARQLGTARAQAVADYLDRHGIAQERLGVSGTGARNLPGRGSEAVAANGVQVYLLEADAPVVGWGPTGPVRR